MVNQHSRVVFSQEPEVQVGKIVWKGKPTVRICEFAQRVSPLLLENILVPHIQEGWIPLLCSLPCCLWSWLFQPETEEMSVCQGLRKHVLYDTKKSSIWQCTVCHWLVLKWARSNLVFPYMKGHIKKVNIHSLIGNKEIYFRIEGWDFSPFSGQTFRNQMQVRLEISNLRMRCLPSLEKT